MAILEKLHSQGHTIIVVTLTVTSLHTRTASFRLLMVVLRPISSRKVKDGNPAKTVKC